jgi:hypothetical protein
LREKYVEACTPEYCWLLTDYLALVIIVCLALSYFYCYDLIGKIFIPGSSILTFDEITFKYAAKGLLNFAVVAHVAEAVYVAYQCRTTLKLPSHVTLKWFIIVCCAGYPVLIRFMNIISTDSKKDS